MKNKEQPLVVTTIHKGVFFGYAKPTTNKTIRLALHGSLKPDKWQGARWWIVELHEPVVSQADKSGSLKRTILADLGRCPF